MRQRIQNIAKSIVLTFFIFFIILFSLTNILFSVYSNNLKDVGFEYRFGLTPINVLLTVLFLLLIYVFYKRDFFKVKERNLLLIFVVLCASIGIFWILINDPVLRSYDDAYNVFTAATKVVSGDYGPLGYKTYLCMHPNNIGLFTYDFIHIYLFGAENALYSIRIVNLVFVIVGYLSVYGIADVAFGNKREINCVAILLMMGNLQFVFYSFYIYGNCISYGLSLLSVYLLMEYLKTGNTKSLIISVVSVSLSICLRMNSIIVLIAEAIYLILDFIEKRKIITIAAVIVMCLGAYIGTGGLQKYWGNRVGIDYKDTTLPTETFLAYGLNYDSRNPGFYFNEIENYHFENGFNPEFTQVKAKEFIQSVLNEFKVKPNKAITFYFRKFLVAWCDPQFDAFAQLKDLNNSDLIKSILAGNTNNCIERIWDANEIIISIGLVAYIYKRRKTAELSELIASVVLIGGFIFHTFWEIKPIYLYQYYLFLIPYASYGLSVISTKFK